MTDKETLIENWTRCLDDNAEEQIHAQTMLAENIDENAASLPALVAQVQGVTEKSRKMRRRVMGIFAILAILLCLSHYALPMQIYSIRNAIRYPELDYKDHIIVPTKTSQEKLLMYGDPSRSDKHLQMRALWECDTKNPAYFAEYSQHYMREQGTLPPDFLKIAGEIDPDNAWFTCTAASCVADGSVKREKMHPRHSLDEAELKKLSPRERFRYKRELVTMYVIIDPIRAQKALDLWRQSLQQNRYENYKTAIHQKRYPLLRNRDTYFSQYAPYFYNASQPSDFPMRYLAEVIIAKLQTADLHTVEGKILIDEVGLYVERMNSTEPASLLDTMRRHAMLHTIYQQAAIMNLDALQPDIAATWQKRNTFFVNYKYSLDEQNRNAPDGDIARINGSFLTPHLTVWKRICVSPKTVTLAYITPQRYAEHSYLYRVVAACLVALLVLLIPYQVLFNRRKPLVRLADEAWQAVPPQKMIRMILCCVLAPLIYLTALVVFTPLTGKQYGAALELVFPVYPAISAMMILLMLPRMLVCRFDGGWENLALKRKSWHRWFGWVSLAIVMVPLHALPWVFKLSNHLQTVQIIAATCWVPAMIWLFSNGCGSTFTRDPFRRVIHGLRRRMVALCSVTVVVTLSLAGVALLQCEKYWVQKDKLMEIPADMPAAGDYEASVKRALHQDLRKIMSK